MYICIHMYTYIYIYNFSYYIKHSVMYYILFCTYNMNQFLILRELKTNRGVYISLVDIIEYIRYE